MKLPCFAGQALFLSLVGVLLGGAADLPGLFYEITLTSLKIALLFGDLFGDFTTSASFDTTPFCCRALCLLIEDLYGLMDSLLSLLIGSFCFFESPSSLAAGAGV